MSARPRRWLMLDTSVLADLRLYDLETVGAALTLVAWEAAGHEPGSEEVMARVCGLSRTKWKTRGNAIQAARALLKLSSQPRATFKRSPLSPALRKKILERDGSVCRYCGDTDGPFHIDHIKPIARGGTDDEGNLCVACAPCNFAKAARFNSEWAW